MMINLKDFNPTITEHDKDVCPICGGSGEITWKDEEGNEFGRPCECEIERQTKARLARSGLAEVMERYTFDSYQVKEPWQARILGSAKAYAIDPSGWFFIGGQSGCGKTHICTAMAVALIEIGSQVRYMKWREDSTLLKRMVNTEDYDGEFGKWKAAHVLYIDDLFKGAVTEADVKLAFDLINERYNNDLPTIISSEKMLSEITDIDEAIGGRIHEKSKYTLNIKSDRKRNIRFEGGVTL